MKAQDPNHNENNIIAEGNNNLRENFRELMRTPGFTPLMLFCKKNNISPQQAAVYYGIVAIYCRGVQEKHGAVHLAGLGSILSTHCSVTDDDTVGFDEFSAILVRAMLAARQFKTVDPITCTVQLRDDIIPATVFNHIFQDECYESFRQAVATESPKYVTTALGPDGLAELQRVISATVEQVVRT